MCGIAGFVGNCPTDRALERLAEAMASTLVHRGPDDGGVWVDAEGVVALAHRRLAILDVSADGHQPMVSHSGRYVICFNGEIYNFKELRADLESRGRAFRGGSDTEVLLHAIEEYGLDTTLGRLVGMFAFALWDRLHRCLSLVRDRYGEKPLYWAPYGDGVAFGSELRALRALLGASFSIDRSAVVLLLKHNYIPAPRSIYAEVRKVEPGTVVSVAPSAFGAWKTEIRRYWSVSLAVARGRRERFKGAFEDAVDELDRLMQISVRGQMASDVPLGAFLSGGVDSSAVVAVMQRLSTVPVSTYSIGFHEAGYDEAGYARQVAAHLGTTHTEWYVGAAEALAVIPELPRVYDEPFADSSQIPTLIVCRLARRHVTVALSGDGGDELFGGYNRYTWARDLWRAIRFAPGPIRVRLATAAEAVSSDRWDSIIRRMNSLLPPSFGLPLNGDRVHKAASLLKADGPAALYQDLQSHWRTPSDVVCGGSEPETLLSARPKFLSVEEFVEYMMACDMQTYLPDDILVKVDRAAMSASLETRAPFLDHRLLEFAASLPMAYKLERRNGKRVLKALLHRYVPRDLVERPKAGFAMPIAEWLRGPLRDWAESLLSERRLRDEGYFEADRVRALWQAHLSGRRSWAYQLWDVLMFQAWLDAHFAAH